MKTAKKAATRTGHINDLEVRKSKNGKSIFTVRDFKKEAVVFEVKGVFLSGTVEEDINDQTRANLFRYDEDKYISPKGQIGDFLNHSCEPNAKVVKRRGRLYVMVIESIEKGQEVTIDYATLAAVDDIWEMICRCESKHCRKKIGRFDSLPEPLKAKYITLGMVPKYILDSRL